MTPPPDTTLTPFETMHIQRGSSHSKVSLVPDGQHDHDEFCEDEGRERDGADVNELVLEEQEGAHHDDAAWKQINRENLDQHQTRERILRH